mmetsp:Transcript_33851/g.79125  ORF Transcript_33851/g.79125 Transcript_33851/m.79125 type:complete len:598 (-) Transcript_33851:102-1895(-)
MAVEKAERMEGDAFDVEVAIRSFVADASCTTLELPASLTVEQRRRAKKCAEQHPEVRCESFGFGSERRLHLFKEPSKAQEAADSSKEVRVDEIQQAVRVKNTFIDDWVSGEPSNEPVQFRSLPTWLLQRTLERCLQQVGDGKLSLAGSLTDTRMDDAASTECPQSPEGSAPTPLGSPYGVGLLQHGLGSLPAGLTVQNTFLHLESQPAVDRIVKSMPDGMFQKCLNQELQTIDETSSCPESAVPFPAEAHETQSTLSPETEVPENINSDIDAASDSRQLAASDELAPEQVTADCGSAKSVQADRSPAEAAHSTTPLAGPAPAVVESVLDKIALLEAELHRCRKELIASTQQAVSHPGAAGAAPSQGTASPHILTSPWTTEPTSPPIPTPSMRRAPAQTPLTVLPVRDPVSPLPPGRLAASPSVISPPFREVESPASIVPQSPAVVPPSPASVPASPGALVPHVTVGTKVVVTGLVKLPDFNGLSGVVQSIDVENARYNLLLDSPTGVHGWKWVKVKGENLIVANSAHSSLTQHGLSSAPPRPSHKSVAHEMRSSLAFQGLSSVPPPGAPLDAGSRPGSKDSRQSSRSAVHLKLNEIV